MKIDVLTQARWVKHLADNILKYFSYFVSSGNSFDIHANYLCDNLHEMSKPVCWENKKNIITLLFADYALSGKGKVTWIWLVSLRVSKDC